MLITIASISPPEHLDFLSETHISARGPGSILLIVQSSFLPTPRTQHLLCPAAVFPKAAEGLSWMPEHRCAPINKKGVSQDTHQVKAPPPPGWETCFRAHTCGQCQQRHFSHRHCDCSLTLRTNVPSEQLQGYMLLVRRAAVLLSSRCLQARHGAFSLCLLRLL